MRARLNEARLFVARSRDKSLSNLPAAAGHGSCWECPWRFDAQGTRKPRRPTTADYHRCVRRPGTPPQYERVMLPMTVLRRFDCVLAETKP